MNFLITILKGLLKLIYLPIKLFKTKNRIVYLSRQRNEKNLDMILLEDAIKKEDPTIEQVFRLKTIGDKFSDKFKYCFSLIGDMYYLATSKVAILDTYSIAVSCLTHKKTLKVVQLWHSLGDIKQIGLQSVGTKQGRDEILSNVLDMHKNYDYVIAPSPAMAKVYMQAFGVEQEKIKICPMPRVDYITDPATKATEFYSLNPGLADKKIVLYLPTYRERDVYIANTLKVEFEDKNDYHLIVKPHLVSKIEADNDFYFNGDFSTYDLMKLADVIVTDYSASAFEASLLLKPVYFYVPDYDEYNIERGLNVNLKQEMADCVYEDAGELFEAINSKPYDLSELMLFRDKYVKCGKNNNTEMLSKFITMLCK